MSIDQLHDQLYSDRNFHEQSEGEIINVNELL